MAWPGLDWLSTESISRSYDVGGSYPLQTCFYLYLRFRYAVLDQAKSIVMSWSPFRIPHLSLWVIGFKMVPIFLSRPCGRTLTPIPVIDASHTGSGTNSISTKSGNVLSAMAPIWPCLHYSCVLVRGRARIQWCRRNLVDVVHPRNMGQPLQWHQNCWCRFKNIDIVVSNYVGNVIQFIQKNPFH